MCGLGTSVWWTWWCGSKWTYGVHLGHLCHKALSPHWGVAQVYTLQHKSTFPSQLKSKTLGYQCLCAKVYSSRFELKWICTRWLWQFFPIVQFFVEQTVQHAIQHTLISIAPRYSIHWLQKFASNIFTVWSFTKVWPSKATCHFQYPGWLYF